MVLMVFMVFMVFWGFKVPKQTVAWLGDGILYGFLWFLWFSGVLRYPSKQLHG